MRKCTVCDTEGCTTHCVYCGIECPDHDLWEVPHDSECPFTLGVFPITDAEEGAVCWDCETVIEDHYCVSWHPDVDAEVALCLGCGASRELIGGE